MTAPCTRRGSFTLGRASRISPTRVRRSEFARCDARCMAEERIVSLELEIQELRSQRDWRLDLFPQRTRSTLPAIADASRRFHYSSQPLSMLLPCSVNLLPNRLTLQGFFR